jgi:hypothetical protein
MKGVTAGWKEKNKKWTSLFFFFFLACLCQTFKAYWPIRHTPFTAMK